MFFAGLFVYRPWCHLFCPFGLAGWLIEKISVFRIAVNYDKCVACETCAKTCPSTVMETILKRRKAIADCFSCGSCIKACPSGAIEFKSGKRSIPPAGKFKR
jgi:NAD-dependent dihydropyrimidine dehydrogenase PreA subunit